MKYIRALAVFTLLSADHCNDAFTPDRLARSFRRRPAFFIKANDDSNSQKANKSNDDQQFKPDGNFFATPQQQPSTTKESSDSFEKPELKVDRNQTKLAIIDPNMQADVDKAASQFVEEVLQPMFKGKIQTGVPGETIKGAALAGAFLAFLASKGLIVSSAAGLSAAYVAISQGVAGDILRSAGSIAWEVTEAATDLASKVTGNPRLKGMTKDIASTLADKLEDIRLERESKESGNTTVLGSQDELEQVLKEAEEAISAADVAIQTADQAFDIDIQDLESQVTAESKTDKQLAANQTKVKGIEQIEANGLVGQQERLEEDARVAEQKRIDEEAEKKQLAKQQQEEQAELKRAAEEAEAKQKRLAQQQAAEAEQKRLAQEADFKQKQLAQQQAAEAEQKRVAEEAEAKQKQLAEEKAKTEEAARIAQQQQLEAARIAEENKLAEAARLAKEAARIAEEARLAEEVARIAEEQRLAEEARVAEEQRLAEEARVAEEQRLVEGERVAEEQRLAEEARIAEEQRLAEEARIAEEQKLVEEARIAEEQKLAEEKRLATENASKASDDDDAESIDLSDEWENTLALAKQGIEGKIFGIDDAVSDEGSKAKWNAAREFAEQLEQGVGETADDSILDDLDEKSLDKATRTAVEQFEEKLRASDKSKTRQRDNWAQEMIQNSDWDTDEGEDGAEIFDDIMVDDDIPEDIAAAARAAVDTMMGAPSGTDWSKLTVAKLKEELQVRGVKPVGKKADLVAALEEYDADLPGTAEEADGDGDGDGEEDETVELDDEDFDFDLGDLDLAELGKQARAAVEVYSEESNGDVKKSLMNFEADEPSDEILMQLENEADFLFSDDEDDKTSETSDNYESMTVIQLKDILRKKGLRLSGNKAELVDRLRSLT